MKNIRVGLFGAGTVGGGVVEILKKKSLDFEKKGVSFELVKICVKNPDKSRDFSLPKHTTVVTDITDILEDDSIDLVLELVGGTGLAWDIVSGALDRGKHVVTANKALVESYLPEIRKRLNKNKSLFFGFEAAVAGGIPVISTLQSHTHVDEVQKISGILNGTTNFILSKMESESADYAEVLKEAQQLGYAEADPTADVEGHDARAKLAILSNLAWGIDLRPDDFFTQGISSIAPCDFDYAKYLKANIKLLAIAEKKHGKISPYVSPVLVPYKNPVSQINGATNVVEITSEFLQKTTLVGEGAGRFPTANSVVADMLRSSSGQHFCFEKNNSARICTETSGKFYVRILMRDGLGIVKTVGTTCEANGVSIDSILQLPIEGDEFPFVITTNETHLSAVQKVVEQISQEDFCRETPIILPILG